jgi:hypothetical protein
MTHPIPPQFRFQDRSRYPIDNIEDFEWWLSNHMSAYQGERIYLPITWTAYYKANGYGKNIHALQQYLNGLDRRKKYFTILQYDDGILNDVSHLDLRTYAMGSPGDYQLPLICQPHAYQPSRRAGKDIFCSFVGRVDTHPIRAKIVEQLSGKDGYYISTRPHRMDQFCEILSRSRYTLCPRGYGLTSFRICEALQYNSLPVYISDRFLIPHNNDLISLLIQDFEIDEIDRILNNSEIKESRPSNVELYQQYFTYTANKELILKDLKQQ